MPQTLGKRDDDEWKKEDWPLVFGWKFFVVLFALSQIGLVWEYRSRERCIAVNNKVLMFLLDLDNHENGEYIGCYSSMKPGNLGDTNNVEMYIFKNCLYKYMYFCLMEVKSPYGAYIFIINIKLLFVKFFEHKMWHVDLC